MPQLSEDALIKGCLKGDRIAQTQLYNQYAGRMYAVCLRYCKNRDEAQDVLQIGFIKIFQNIASFKGNCPLEFWMRKIMVNSALNALRQQKKSVLYLVDMQEHTEIGYEEAFNADNKLSQFESEELINIIQKIPTGYQLVFNLYAIEGYSHKEISEMLSISESTSKSQYSRARKHIQNLLEQHHNISVNNSLKTTNQYDEQPILSLS